MTEETWKRTWLMTQNGGEYLHAQSFLTEIFLHLCKKPRRLTSRQNLFKTKKKISCRLFCHRNAHKNARFHFQLSDIDEAKQTFCLDLFSMFHKTGSYSTLYFCLIMQITSYENKVFHVYYAYWLLRWIFRKKVHIIHGTLCFHMK